MPGHEVDGLGRDALRRHHQVALVLAVGRIHHHHHAAGPDVRDRLVNGRERRVLQIGVELFVAFIHGHLPDQGSTAVRARSSRSTYLPTRSDSRLTLPPRAIEPRLVTSSVCGMIETEKPISSNAVTVRLMPLTQIEPFSIT